MMPDSRDRRKIVNGITLDASGMAAIDPGLNDALFDLAIKLEEPTGLPVDIEHVVAAIIIAAQKDEIESSCTLDPDDYGLIELLASHVTKIFQVYGNDLGETK